MKLKDWIAEVEADEQLAGSLQLVPKTNRRTQADLLHVVNRLAYLAYLTGERDQAFYLAGKMLALEFDGDYRYWEPVQAAGLLLAQLDADRYAQIVRERMDQAREFGDEDLVFGKQRVHKRCLNGQRLTALEAEVAAAKDQVQQMNKRVILLFHLFYLVAYSADLELDPQLVQEKIKQNESILQDYMARHGLQQLYPYG